ncbi:hypothetical protein A3709_18830 [Halioglobus sp. HI00S01]|uniref:KTSC domain-containing protein n=1 Tax=Halioglobus sp. HI00S01 TaxID=1822214 RepID=UPI0007C39747|nr:KTSC domain-containing protein [Halioglobus sp. HI00S01]KZX57680.1 hypothetical protein A3709_18830 [Halioglobus sp. HI00S01]
MLAIALAGYPDVDVGHASKTILGYSTPQSRKLIAGWLSCTEPHGGFDPNFVILAFRLSHAGFNRDILLEYLSAYQRAPLGDELSMYETNAAARFSATTAESLRQHYTDRRLLRMFFALDFRYWEDLSYQLRQIEELVAEVKSALPKKPKSFNQLHESLSVCLAHIERDDFDLNQREDVVGLDGLRLTEELTVRVPKSHYDMVAIGAHARFCLGDGEYSEGVAKGLYSVVSICRAQRAVYGVQFHRHAIIEARGVGNSVVPDEVICLLREHILRPPEATEDFIVVDNSFIRGYRWFDDSLYVLFGNGNCYAYAGVSMDVYEEFVTAASRGSFFSTQIKPDYDAHLVSSGFEDAPHLASADRDCA